MVGRRGLAGTVLVHKIASGLADQGLGLDQVKQGAESVLDRLGSVGIGLGHCSVPGSQKEDGEEQETLGSDELEIGMGIHNEPGVTTESLSKASSLIPRLIKMITSTTDKERSYVPFKNDGKDQVVLLVNNLGGISALEMNLVAKEAMDELGRQGITVERVGVGKYMTSINLPGFSLTLLLLPRDGDKVSTSGLNKQQILDLLDRPAQTPGWIPLTRPRRLEECLIKSETRVESSSEPVKRQGDPVPCKCSTFLGEPDSRLICASQPKQSAILTRRLKRPSSLHVRVSLKPNQRSQSMIPVSNGLNFPVVSLQPLNVWPHSRGRRRLRNLPQGRR